MKIIIDNIIFAWQKSGGISAVWYELIRRMLNDKTLDEVLGFVNFDRSGDNIFYRRLDIPAALVARRETKRWFAVKRYLSQKMACRKPFIFHSSYYRVCSNPKAVNVVTVHDFTYEKYCSGVKRMLHSWSKRKALRDADHIVCISENTKSDLLSLNKDIDSSKISVIYNGASEDFCRLPDSERYQAGSEPYMVFVGSRASYKNFNLAVEVAAMSGIRLAVVGNKLSDDERASVEKALGGNYIEYGRITNEELNRLYNKAFALIYPSLYEGFGLPVVEAQKAGCPVLALHTSSIPEIIGDTDQLVKKPEAGAFVEQIERLKEDSYRRKIVEEGEKNARRFSWDNTYRQYTALYHTLMQKYKKA